MAKILLDPVSTQGDTVTFRAMRPVFEQPPHRERRHGNHGLQVAGVTAAETMCFGDNCNDLDMIRRAGIGVAMANAPADVRQGADVVTRSNDEDGVGHAIHKFVLNNVHAVRRAE